MTQKKEHPIKVQLSKDDLKEVVVVVKNFVYESVLEELHRQNKKVFLNCSELDKRVSKLEIIENNHRMEISILKEQLSCSVKTGHRFLVDGIHDYTTTFRCFKCDLRYEKAHHILDRKEKKLLKIAMR